MSGNVVGWVPDLGDEVVFYANSPHAGWTWTVTEVAYGTSGGVGLLLTLELPRSCRGSDGGAVKTTARLDEVMPARSVETPELDAAIGPDDDGFEMLPIVSWSAEHSPIAVTGTSTFIADVVTATREQRANHVSSTTQEQDAIAELRREVAALKLALDSVRTTLSVNYDEHEANHDAIAGVLYDVRRRLDVIEGRGPKPAASAAPARREGWPGT